MHDHDDHAETRAALAAAHDALGDLRIRCATIGAAVDRDHITGADASEAIDGIRRQAERLIHLAGQLRRAQTDAAARAR
jgi:hypothetical protein